MGSTTVFADAKRSKSSVNAHISAVQVLVNASGKNARSTFCFPRNSARDTSRPAVDGSVNSGAGAPTSGFIVVLTMPEARGNWNRGQPGGVIFGAERGFAPPYLGVTTGMPHTLPALPYDFAALEPHIDAQTMQIHHGKHHQAYVNNLNAAIEKAPELADRSVEDLVSNLNAVPEAVRTAVRNNGGGHWNHSFFWTIMAPNAGGEPSGALAAAVDGGCGGFAKLEEQFNAAATSRFGSGWAWRVRDGNGLTISSTPNQDNPLMDGKKAGDVLLGVDVWEHAYYLKYQNRRPDYLNAWWNVVNWREVEKRFGR